MTTPTRLLADTLIKGGVDAFIAEHRAQEKSWRKIAKAIEQATKGRVDVTGETVRAWSLTASQETAP